MRAFHRTVLGLVSVVALSVGAPEQADAASGVCVPVRATGIGQDLGGGKTEADIFVGRVRVGSTTAAFVATPPVGTIVSFSGELVFTARVGLGTLTVALSGTLDLATGAFDSAGPVTGATGLLAGTTGNLRLTGVEDLTTGRFTETINGQLCAGARPRALHAAIAAT